MLSKPTISTFLVHGALTHEAYLARIDADATRARLASWVDGDDAWMKLYLDETPA